MTVHSIDLALAHQAELRRLGARRATQRTTRRAALAARKNRLTSQETPGGDGTSDRP
jgi:hypothetical protein